MSSHREVLAQLGKYAPEVKDDLKLDIVDGLKEEQVPEVLEGYSSVHPDYSVLSGRFLAYLRHQKLRKMTFTERMERIHVLPDQFDDTSRRFSNEGMRFIRRYKKQLDEAMVYERDYDYQYVGIKTIERVYLAAHRGKVLELPQDMHMRIAVQIATHLTGRDKKDRLSFCLQEYEDLSTHKKIYATPICCRAMYENANLSSCFCIEVPDSINGIYDSLKECANIHAKMGGCAINMQKVRARGSIVRSTGGRSSGLLAFAKNFDHTSYTVESGGRRSGSNALWGSDHHLEILDVLNARSLRATEKTKMPTLFQGLFLTDVFMHRVEDCKDYMLLDPATYPGLSDVYGEEFRQLYEKYEKQAERVLEEGVEYTDSEGNVKTKKGITLTDATSGMTMTVLDGNCAKVRAIDLWCRIKAAISDQSIPFLVAKDAVNRSNQHSNLGTVKMSNLCTEIMQHTSEDLTAVCTLGNLVLSSFMKNGEFDYNDFMACSRRMCIGLNAIIDAQILPTERAMRSSKYVRAIGMGTQGFADSVLDRMEVFDDEWSRQHNRDIAEALYYSALDASCQLAEDTQPYPAYKVNGGSYLANGKFHWEMDGKYPYDLKCDWEGLRGRIAMHGVANSHVTAYAPTSTTSLIHKKQESIQPIMSNITTRTVLSGDYVHVQPELVRELEKLDMWNEDTVSVIVKSGGSVANLNISDRLKAIFRTAYEIGSKSVIEMARDRSYFTDQGQSLNLFVSKDLDFSSFLDTAIFYGWRLGNKNLMYYARQQKATEALYVNVSKSVVEVVKKVEESDEETADTATSDGDESLVMSGSVSAAGVESLSASVSIDKDQDGPICRMEEGCIWCQ
jgi:ribonucleoside-diphosphate reductase alpha chain